MQPLPQPFDLAELSRCVDAERERRELTLTDLAHAVGVSTSTIRRLRTADDAEADGVLALIAWLGDPPERFMPGSAGGTPLPPAGTGYVRVDMDRVLADQPGVRRKPTRTTIQRLATAAQRSDRSVASLTRWSPC